MLAYFLKVNVAIVLFYAFYRLFFYKDTFFGWRRTALLCFFAVSAAVPLLNIQTWITEQEPMVAMADLYASVVLPELTVGTEAAPTDWKSILSEYANIAYWGIAALLMIRLVVQLAGIIRLACRCRKIQIGNTSIHLLPKADGPFSFFHWIFIHPSSHTEEEFNEILTHEQTHARQWHSIDVIISELVCIFCWCNPFAWLMKREIRTNLEYMADARVLENGYDSKTYQYHLLGLSHQKAAATIYNSFNVLPLKKRIKMMNKKRTKEIGRTKARESCAERKNPNHAGGKTTGLQDRRRWKDRHHLRHERTETCHDVCHLPNWEQLHFCSLSRRNHTHHQHG